MFVWKIKILNKNNNTYKNISIIQIKMNYTEEQLNYINYNGQDIDNNNSILIACAGSGKTQCIVMRMIKLVERNIYKSDEIIMLTFSKNTQMDFIRRIKKVDTNNLILETNIRTIDSFAKLIIDEKNNIDVNLLSYTFMKYLEETPKEQLLKNKYLKKIKTMFIDEAQDLNEIQYNIISYMQNKLNISVNMIGDPNQNIYQFRNSSDKYLMNFKGKRFYLTINFRSSKPIVEFSKYLRPYQNTDIVVGNNNLLHINDKPHFFFNKDDEEITNYIDTIIKEIKEKNINFSEIAIISPTRGGMYSSNSHGLCLITNMLNKHKIPFIQWYEEADETNGNICYKPLDNHINILTYMGSKGLEWKYVIVLDADVCLINKNIFNETKHNNDRYLLYVACTRAIEHMFIFTKYIKRKTGIEYKINPWFKEIPSDLYILYTDVEFIFPAIESKNKIEIDRSVTKIINNLDEKTLYDISNMLNYSNITKKIKKIFRIKCDEDFISPIFLGRFIEALFNSVYRMTHNKDKLRFYQLEEIIYAKKNINSKYVKRILIDWFESNRKTLTWQTYNPELYSSELIEQIDKYFDKTIDISKHIIVGNNYYNEYIIANKENIKNMYGEYLNCRNKKQLPTYIFKIVLIIYSIETQHYYHINNEGIKFQQLFKIHENLINKVINFASRVGTNFVANNLMMSRDGIEGEIDLLTDSNEIYEIKCVKELNIKHFLQVLIYNLIKDNYEYDDDKVKIKTININFYNLYKGEHVIYECTSDKFDVLFNILKDSIKKQSII